MDENKITLKVYCGLTKFGSHYFRGNSKYVMVGAQLTDLHLSENLPEWFCSRPHQVGVKSPADWERFGPRKLETSRVLLEEIQSLGTHSVMIKEEEEITF